MKRSEAQKIVADLIAWNMFHMGLVKEMPAAINYTLEEMFKANEIIKRLNKQKLALADTGRKGRRKIQLTLDERLIAAMFVAMQYEANNVSIACCNGKHIGVFK